MGALLRLLGLSAAPAAPAAGDTWYRSDLAQVHASDGGARPLVVGPAGNLPAPRSGHWHYLPAYGATGTANVPDGRMFALPLYPGRASTVTGVAANVTLALVGGNLRFGLYASDGVLPTNLITDYGTVSAGLTGVKSVTSMSDAVSSVLYYVVVGRQGGVLNLGLTTRATGDPIVSEAAPTLTGNLNAYYIDGVSGSLPASFGTPAGSATGPGLQVRLA